MDLLTEGSLCTGYGGITLGLRLVTPVRTLFYVEWNPFLQQLIQRRITDGFLDDAPIWDDITTFDGTRWRDKVDILTGGVPCQPHSSAGSRKGADDERNLWPAARRIIGEVQPKLVLLENVRGISQAKYGKNPLSKGRKPSLAPYASTILGDFAVLGYDTIAGLIPAASVGAPHLRWRWFCLAYSPSLGQAEHSYEQASSREEVGRRENVSRNGENGDVANSDSTGRAQQRRAGPISTRYITTERQSQDVRNVQGRAEPSMGRVADKHSNRMGINQSVISGILQRVVKRK